MYDMPRSGPMTSSMGMDHPDCKMRKQKLLRDEKALGVGHTYKNDGKV